MRTALLLAMSCAVVAYAELNSASSPPAGIDYSVQEVILGSTPVGVDAVTWEARAVLPSVEERPSGVCAGGYFYVFGGNVQLNAVRRYDPVANSWASMASSPTAITNSAATYFPGNNRIYVFGGYNPSNNYNRIYNIATNSWSSGANCPYTDYGTAAATLGNYIYVLWGSSYPGYFRRYDPNANSWSALANCPNSASHGSLCAKNGYVWALGGWSALPYFRRYDPATNTWANMASIPQGRQGAGLDTCLDRIYAYSGGNGWSPIQNCYSYVPATNSWVAEGNMLYPHSAGA